MDALTYATLQVVVDGQAWLFAVLTAGGDAPEEEFRAAMTQFKEETAELISSALETIIARAGEEGEEE